MKTAHTPDRTTSRDDGDLDAIDCYVRAWLAEHDQRIARRGRHLVRSSNHGPWHVLDPQALVDAITSAAAAFGEPLDPARLLATVDALRITAPRLDTRPKPIAGRVLRRLTRSIIVTR